MSVLDDVKKLMGVDEQEDAFDTDLLLHINTISNVLTQMGVGPSEGVIIDEGSEWEDITESATLLNMVKTYVFLRVRLLFDPPQSGGLIEAINKQVTELEWRIYTICMPGYTYLEVLDHE